MVDRVRVKRRWGQPRSTQAEVEQSGVQFRSIEQVELNIDRWHFSICQPIAGDIRGDHRSIARFRDSKRGMLDTLGTRGVEMGLSEGLPSDTLREFESPTVGLKIKNPELG